MARNQDRHQAKAIKQRQNWLTVVIIVAAVALVGFTVYQATHKAKPQTPDNQAGSAAPAASGGGPVPLEVTPAATPVKPPSGLQARPEKGSLAPDFEVTDIATGQKHRLSDLRGKPVYINFWATWCPWCKVEMPSIQKVYQEHKGEFYVLLVDADIRETPDMMKKFAQDNHISLPMLYDATGEAANNYLIRALPTSVFINKQGVITAVYPGAMNERQLLQFLDEATK